MGARKYQRRNKGPKHTIGTAMAAAARKTTTPCQDLNLARGFLGGGGKGELELVTVVAVQVGRYNGERIQLTRGSKGGALWEGKPPKWLKELCSGREIRSFRAQVTKTEVRLCRVLK